MNPAPQFEPEIEEALHEYRNRFRHPDMPGWIHGELLALFHEEHQGKATRTWRDPWPHGERKGVYFVFNREMKLLYIGKASMNSCLGARLSSWFWGSCNDICKVNGTWSEMPFFIQTLAMPEEIAFEAPAIEEFLIGKLNPPDNTAGRKR